MKPLAPTTIDPEIDDNDLAQSVLEFLDRLRPYAGWIVAAALATLLAVAAWILVSAQAAAGRTQSWDAFLSALSEGRIENFNDVLRRHPGTLAAQWSRLVIADAQLAEGTQLLFSDREKASTRLRTAVDFYTAVLAERPTGMAAEKAVFGLARARESLGQLEEARRGYEAVVKEYPDSGLVQLSTDRAAALGRESTRQWYDWFAAQVVPPPVKPADAAAAPEAPADAGTAKPE